MFSGNAKNTSRKTQGREPGSREPAISQSEGSRLRNRLVREQGGCQGTRSPCETKVKENNTTETRQESEKLQDLEFESLIKLVLQGWTKLSGTKRTCVTKIWKAF